MSWRDRPRRDGTIISKVVIELQYYGGQHSARGAPRLVRRTRQAVPNVAGTLARLFGAGGDRVGLGELRFIGSLAAPIPEPATAGLLLLGAAAALGRRRRCRG